jgi:cytochrome c oxidase subunit II
MNGLKKKIIPAAGLLIAAIPAAAQHAAASAEVVGQPTPRGWLIQPQVTELGQEAARMHNVILMPVIVGITLLVMLLLLWVMVRYRASVNPVPARTSHNTFVEVLWTLTPIVILVLIFWPSFELLSKQYSQPRADLTVKVIGHQWYWSYQYPDNGNFEVVSNVLSDAQDKQTGQPRLLGVDEKMVVPVNKVIKVIVTSDDVIHSFAVPAFWTKMDAVPGRLNETWFKVEKPGVYYGACSELCGAKHGYMPIAVEVLPEAQFAQWVKSKGGTIGGAKTPATTGPSPPAAAEAPVTPETSTPSTISGVNKSPVTNQGATANQGPTA